MWPSRHRPRRDSLATARTHCLGIFRPFSPMEARLRLHLHDDPQTRSAAACTCSNAGTYTCAVAVTSTGTCSGSWGAETYGLRRSTHRAGNRTYLGFFRRSLLVERNSEFGTRASVGAVHDRAFFRSLTTARGHRPRLQWYQSHCYALLARIGNVVAGFRPRLHRIIRSMF